MRYLIFTNHFYPESFRCNDIAFDLAKRGHKIKVLTSIPDYPKGKFYKGYGLFKKRVEKIENVTIVRVPIIPRGDGRKFRMVLNYASSIFFFFFYAIYQAIFYKFDCIYVHDTSPAFIGLPAILIKKLRRTPIVLWILDMWPESLVAGGINNPKVFNVIQKMMDYIYRNCDKIQISSLGFRTLLNKRRVSDDKIEYLPNWSDDAITQKSNVEEIPQLPNGFIVMFAGNIGEAQNIENLLASACLLKESKDIHFVFLGDGRKKEWADNYVKNNNLFNTVHFMGRFSIEKMHSFFKKADVMVVSLCDEVCFNLTLPAKVQAYMSCSKSIIGFLNGEGQNIIKDAQCGWSVNANDIEGFANLIVSISKKSKSELELIGKNGYNYYLKNFKKTICIDKVETTLTTISQIKVQK